MIQSKQEKCKLQTQLNGMKLTVMYLTSLYKSNYLVISQSYYCYLTHLTSKLEEL